MFLISEKRESGEKGNVHLVAMGARLEIFIWRSQRDALFH